MFQKANKIPYTTNEVQLKSLLTNRDSLSILIDYLEEQEKKKEEEFMVTSTKAVFNIDIREEAILKYGMKKGISEIKDRLTTLLTTGK